MGILLIFFSVCTNITEGVIVKLQGKNAKNSNAYIFNGIIALASMLFFVITDKGGFYFPKEILLYAIPSAICYCIALVFTYLALANGSFAMSMMILSYSIVFPIIYGIVFLQEKTSYFTYLGFAIIAISLFLTRGDTKSENSQFSFKWLFFIVVSALGNGFFAIIKKMQQVRFEEKCNNEFMIISLGITAGSLMIYGIIKDRKISISLKSSLCALLAGLTNGVTNMLTLVINTMVAISLSSPLNTGIKIVLSFLISVVIYNEKYLKRQYVGVALGTVALILLNL